MKKLERKEIKKLFGGVFAAGSGGTRYFRQCTCPNGNVEYCSCETTASECFEIIYQACGGQPATRCTIDTCIIPV